MGVFEGVAFDLVVTSNAFTPYANPYPDGPYTNGWTDATGCSGNFGIIATDSGSSTTAQPS